jgi:lipopolysaccharide biosynthesis glycosyltransferase
LYETVSPENQKILTRQVGAHPAFKLEMIDVSPYFAEINFLNLNFSRAAHYRFALPWIMQDYPFVIYLDCDLVCRVDIARLLDYDVSGCALAAARRIIGTSGWDWMEGHTKGLGLENRRDYFNSGVLVFNTKRFRETVDLQELCRMAEENEFIFPDQDGLNIVFKGDVLYLPIKWNSNLYRNEPAGLTEEEEYDYREAQENPAILHYNGDKPLEGGGPTERQKPFWDYASRTPFFEVLQRKLAENEAKSRAAETIDPENEECILFSNDKREAQAAELALDGQGIAYKTRQGDADFAYKVFVANEDVDSALDTLMSDL